MINALCCARCGHLKGLGAYAVFAKKEDPATRRTLYVERDEVCRKCRGEQYRGVPDEIVRYRNREAALVQQLARVRAKIRHLMRQGISV